MRRDRVEQARLMGLNCLLLIPRTDQRVGWYQLRIFSAVGERNKNKEIIISYFCGEFDFPKRTSWHWDFTVKLFLPQKTYKARTHTRLYRHSPPARPGVFAGEAFFGSFPSCCTPDLISLEVFCTLQTFFNRQRTEARAYVHRCPPPVQ